MAINTELRMQRRSRYGDDVAHLYIVALVTGGADECSCRRESVAVGWMWRTLPRTYVRGYGEIGRAHV